MFAGKRATTMPSATLRSASATAGAATGTATIMRLRTTLTYRSNGDSHAGAGREAVVDADDRHVANIGRRTIAAVFTLAPFQLGALARDDVIDLLARNRQSVDHPLIDERDPRGRNRAHRKLLATGYAQFANEDDVHRNIKPACDFITYGYTTTWEREHDRIAIARIIGKPRSELAPGGCTIAERRHPGSAVVVGIHTAV